jgi:hypothetical protein
MSQENVEVVRRLYPGSVDLVATLADPERFEAVRVAWEPLMLRDFETVTVAGQVPLTRSLDIEEVFDAGDQVVTIVRQHGKARHGGPEVEMRFAQVWTFRDGLGARMEMCADRDEALEAAGLSE